MSQYETLDALILQAIEAGRSPLYYRQCNAEARRIAQETGREDFRVLDGRLQALRKSGKVIYSPRFHSTKQGGWRLA